MKSLPELHIISGPGEGSSLALPDAGMTYTVGDGACDLPIRSITGGRIVFHRGEGPRPELRLVAAEGLPVLVNSIRVALPVKLDAGDIVQIALSPPILIEYRDPTAPAGTKTAEMLATGPGEPALGDEEKTAQLTRDAVSRALGGGPQETDDERTVMLDDGVAPPPDLVTSTTEEDRTVLADEPLHALATEHLPARPLAPEPEATVYAGAAGSPAAPETLAPREPPATKAAPPPTPLPTAKAGSSLRLFVGLALGFMLLAFIGGGATLWYFLRSRAPRAQAPAAAAPVKAPSLSPAPSPLTIARIDPPSATVGSEITIEISSDAPEPRVFFGAAAAVMVSSEGRNLKVQVPDVGAAPSVPVTVRSGEAVTPPFSFVVDAPALPAVAFRYEVTAQSFAGGDTATVYLGPIPLFVLASKGAAANVEERARLATLDLDAARTALAGSVAPALTVQKGPKSWDVVVAVPGAPPVVKVLSVGPEEAAYLGAVGQAVTPERLAGYWMSLLHDAIAAGFSVGRLDRLPADSPGGKILDKMVKGGLERGFQSLTPDERAALEGLAVNPPAALAGFEGKYRGSAAVDRKALPEIRWPNAELQIDLTVGPIPGLTAAGELTLTWITALDESGRNKTYQKIGTFPFDAAPLDASNLNHLRVEIEHAGIVIPFDLHRKADPASGVVSIEGRYESTDLVLKKM